MAMRIAFLLLALLLFRETKATTSDAATFKHHTFEFSVTPAVDYHFITYSSRAPQSKQLTAEFYRPFLGCNVAISYLYRPIKYVAVSSGISYTENVAKLGKFPEDMSGSNTTYIFFNGYEQSGYLSVPIFLHGFLITKHTVLDFSSGPEFLFPIYSISKFTQSGSTEIMKSRQIFSPSEMRTSSFLSWDVSLTASIPVNNLFYISIGPEMKFITLKSFDPAPDYSQFPHQINYYTGIKVCFRLAPNFAGKTKKSTKTATPK